MTVTEVRNNMTKNHLKLQLELIDLIKKIIAHKQAQTENRVKSWKQLISMKGTFKEGSTVSSWAQLNHVIKTAEPEKGSWAAIRKSF